MWQCSLQIKDSLRSQIYRLRGGVRILWKNMVEYLEMLIDNKLMLALHISKTVETAAKTGSCWQD